MNFVVGVVVLFVANVQHGMASFPSTSGAVYTRWGHKKCPSHAKLVYSGFAGGSHYSHQGGAVEPLCLPNKSQVGDNEYTMSDRRGYVYGAEYETSSSGELSHVHDQDVPCAVCEAVGKKSIIVIPARNECFDEWEVEYKGYLMSGHYHHPAASTYTCVDENPQTMHGGKANENGYLFYPVEARCGTLACPPFRDGWKFTCVVCSKD